MRKFLSYAVAAAMVLMCVSLSAQTQAKKAVKRKAPGAATSKKRPAARTATGQHQSAGAAQARSAAKARKGTTTVRPKAQGKTVAGKGKKPVKRTTWRNRQMAPTADRYRDIQAALAAKGYLPADAATGQWNQESVDALRRFQSEQHIEGNGKVNALSLIALGLGPKHDQQASLKPPPAAPGVAPAQTSSLQ
jgi:hypothetical protein